MNVKNVFNSDGDCARASRALAAGFNKNPLLTEVELGEVPKGLAESVRGTLCTNTALSKSVTIVLSK